MTLPLSSPQSVFYLSQKLTDMSPSAISIANETLYPGVGGRCADAAEVMRRAAGNVVIEADGEISRGNSHHLMIATFEAEVVRRMVHRRLNDVFFDRDIPMAALGYWPEEVLKRLDCAFENKAFLEHMLNTAEDFMVAEIMDAVSKLPGAYSTPGKVTWAGALADKGELYSWLDVPGPGDIPAVTLIQGVSN